MPAEYYLARWNLENLFNEENAPPVRRTEKVLRTISNDIVGWPPQRRDRKVAQLASVIAQMNGAAGPDFLGICEVENRFVIDLLARAVEGLLPARFYAVAHADTDDARGIDVAFLYDDTKFVVPAGETFFHVVMRRNATREIVQVNFQTVHGGRTCCLRESLAVPQWRAVRIRRISTHCRRDARLLPPTSPRGPWPDRPRAGDG